MLLAIGNASLALPQLLGKFARYFVDSGIEIVFGILRVDIGARDGKMHLDDMLSCTRLVVEENDMGGEYAVGQLLQMSYLIRHICVDGCGKGQMSGAKVDLHA
jgi:hypothetical protein